MLNRILLCLAVAFAISFAFADELLAVQCDTVTALIDKSGTEIIPPGIYSDIRTLIPDTLYAVRENDRYALVDGTGNRLSEAVYDEIFADNGVILFRDDELYGALNADGSVLLPAAYQHIIAYNDRCYIRESQTGRIFCVVDKNTRRDTGLSAIDGPRPFSDGLAVYLDAQTLCYGAINADGECVVAPEYSALDDFRNGYAIAVEDRIYGIIDENGETCLSFVYGCIVRDEQYFYALDEAGIGVYDTDLAFVTLIEGAFDSMTASDGFIILGSHDSQYLYRFDGTLMLETDSRTQITVLNDERLILFDGKWGTAKTCITDLNGEPLSDPYQYILPLNAQYCVYGTMRTAEYAGTDTGEIQLLVDLGSLRYGLLDMNGTKILDAQFTDIRRLADNCILLETEDGAIIMNDKLDIIWS